MRLIDSKNFVFLLAAILAMVTRGHYFTFYTPWPSSPGSQPVAWIPAHWSCSVKEFFFSEMEECYKT